MALSIKEQLKVLRGDVVPNDADGFNYMDLVKQVAVDFAYDSLSTMKDASGDPLAASYRQKIVDILSQFTRGRADTITIPELLVSIYTGTYTSLSNASTVQWVAFLAENMLQAVEVVAGTYPEEKTAYVQLP